MAEKFSIQAIAGSADTAEQGALGSKLNQTIEVRLQIRFKLAAIFASFYPFFPTCQRRACAPPTPPTTPTVFGSSCANAEPSRSSRTSRHESERIHSTLRPISCGTS
jgi:hypothetical protein